MTPEDTQKLLAKMLKKIEECKTPLDLRTWAKANEQQVELLADDQKAQLREIWQERLTATKPTAKKTEARNAA